MRAPVNGPQVGRTTGTLRTTTQAAPSLPILPTGPVIWQRQGTRSGALVVRSRSERAQGRTRVPEVTHVEYLPPGSVIRCVARCRESLSGMGARDGLVMAVEGMARGVLLQRLPNVTA